MTSGSRSAVRVALDDHVLRGLLRLNGASAHDTDALTSDHRRLISSFEVVPSGRT